MPFHSLLCDLVSISKQFHFVQRLLSKTYDVSGSLSTFGIPKYLFIEMNTTVINPLNINPSLSRTSRNFNISSTGTNVSKSSNAKSGMNLPHRRNPLSSGMDIMRNDFCLRFTLEVEEKFQFLYYVVIFV